MNVLELIVIAVTFLLALWGFRRGFVRKLASMVSLILSVVLVSLALPYVTDFIKNNTPVYGYIEEQCRQAFFSQAADQLLSDTGTGASDGTLSGLGREEIKALMEQYGYDSSVVDTLTDEELEQYKEQYIEQYASQLLGTSEEESGEIDRNSQMEIIDSLPIPDALKDLLINYNNDEGYKSLDVSSFQEYLVAFIATMILNALSFIVAVILVQLILRAVLAALDILSHLPVIHIVNRVAGMALGLLQALFLLWLFFLVLTMLQTTTIGQELMAMVEESTLLNSLYQSNLFMEIVLQAASLFV